MRTRLVPVIAVLAAVAGAATPAHGLRVVTFNMLHGGLDSGLRGDGRYLDLRLDLAAAGLRALDADVVALQEASVGRARGNLADRLGTKIGLPHVVLAAPDDWLTRLAALALGFDEGPAILTRFPVRGIRSRAIARCGEILPRSLVCAAIATKGGPLTVCSTHLDGSECQLADLAAALQDDCTSPLVLMGDLNAPEDSAGVKALVQRLGLVDAFRSTNPTARGFTVWQPVTEPRPVARRRVDYVFVRPGGGRTLEVRGSRVVLDRPHPTRVGTLWASDHHAVLADLSLVPHAGGTMTGCDARADGRDPN